MPFTLTMPKLSPTMEEGMIVKWHKKEGDRVNANDVLLEVATDKATVEHGALDEGWLRKIIVKEGGEAKVNQPIAIFTAEQNESIEGYKPEGLQPETKAVQEESKVEEKTDVPAEAKGGVGSIRQPSFVPEPPLEHYEFEGVTENSKRVLSSPLARKLAKERGLDLTTVKGTGPNQRIMSRDLERAQSTGVVAFGRRVQPTKKPGSYHEESLTPMRKVIAQRLQDAKTFIPHIYVEQTVNAMLLDQTRDQLRNVDVKVSFNDFVVKACALALVEHPNVNSGFNSANQTIIRFDTIDISIAVSVSGGLITPIVRHANYKNLGEISLEIRQLARRAKDGKLDASEYKGGSFTVSNLGMYGVTAFKAIINPPQAAILAVSGIQNVPVVQNGVVVPGKIMNICLSADHRVVDGVAAAEFVKTVQKYLENPASLLF
ncbi:MULTISPECIES: pyruvate dehydrogenase complex dihydrolipoamide acetyltransferase [Parachlamydia]|jgi:pyruvate dehydrogenase E2 component (dihydrolipoamide acetyltransferase)|uniref:pyruvate dehydrogenase complex dihydrolipoamide acetyltransferase n=1 Tax=Parachlamydia TaxID=83551 RepID=UPI00031C2066|nr:pyruvate dehydrogenase complex dihydrolipoamide acetyltransferase [Parachlamydia acanthamoebae]